MRSRRWEVGERDLLSLGRAYRLTLEGVAFRSENNFPKIEDYDARGGTSAGNCRSEIPQFSGALVFVPLKQSIKGKIADRMARCRQFRGQRFYEENFLDTLKTGC